ncbi:Interferon-induced GTP-binding protein Mx [Paramyrothecium foliicola]|nr:Interferon-induced GTP-binding protein Mx [Paramyrothecium foliicola]
MGSLFVDPPPSTSARRATDHTSSREMAPSIESSLNTQGLANEQRGLLDLIDKLQFAQLDNVKLPQIVVVGDQSAGKSSVLEALTGTPFPRDAGACTRFATEIRMRRSKQTQLKVSIIPDKNRPYNEQARLLQYGGDVTGDEPFDKMMRDATELIAPRNIPGRFAARDVLVVEKSGPDMPLLTLVDLPGLVRVANRDQSEGDISTIEALSDRYMKSSRTIILAVVGGNNDYVQAPILRKARQFDPTGSRTIGVLTKPDMTERIGLEDKFIELVTNKDQENHFKLGWFVLLNPGPGEAWLTPQDRAHREADFFTRGKWSALPPQMWGVGALQQKLSTQLQRHIGKHVKTLRRQIQEALDKCEGELKAMGSGKDTVEEMRFEMGELFTASNNLVMPAVHGSYKSQFGERFFARHSHPKGTPSQNLRARVREESERFARRFRQYGRQVSFSPTSGGNTAATPNLPTPGTVGDRSKKDFAHHEVEPLLRQIRGSELPLDSNPRAPYILFQEYSRNWPILAHEYKDNMGIICNEFLVDVIDHAWPLRMHDPLRFHFLELKIRELMESAEKELNRLTDDMELEIQPFDPEYEDRLRRWRAESTENGGTYTEAEEVLEKMLIYYDLTARIFTRNVITQVVERHLMLGMLRLFNPIEILRMSDSTIESIAAENKETRDRRKALKTQKTAIEEARRICASLAMRSELRAYEDEPVDETATDDEDSPQRHASTRRPASSSQAPAEPSRRPEPPRRQTRDERPRSTINGEAGNRTPTTPRIEANGSNNNPYHQDQQRDWDQPFYTTTGGSAAAPAPHVPQPPPRPQKVGIDEPERYYDATPRGEMANQNGGRGKESARQRLASAMRMGS